MVGYEVLRGRNTASTSTFWVEKDIVIEAVLHTLTFEGANHLGGINVALEVAHMGSLTMIPYRIGESGGGTERVGA